MRLKHGFLKSFSEKAGISRSCLCDMIYTRKRPGRKRAKYLEDVSKEKFGRDVPAMLWLYGSGDEIKQVLSGM